MTRTTRQPRQDERRGGVTGDGGTEREGVMKGALAVSPGSNDKTVYETGLAELNQTYAPTAYMETEFHTWTHGTTFLGDPWQHSWLIALGIDQCRGYPRAPSGAPTRTKACNW